jgi:hypothetical protein
MSNPNKVWSFGGAAGRATGSGLAGVASGAIAGSLGGPLGIPLGMAVFGAVGFAGGYVGACLGYWWDALERDPETFGSGALFSLVVNGVLNIVFLLLLGESVSTAHRPIMLLCLLVGFSSLISAALKSLLDDLHAAYSQRTTY